MVDASRDPLEGLSGDERIVKEAHDRYQRCVNWESSFRSKAAEDERFAEGDSDNRFQWPSDVVDSRKAGKQTAERPMLTINKIRQHNLQIENDAKQNKPGVNIRPTGGDASYKSAQTFQAVVRHIEYDSAAEQAYDWAFSKMVKRGCGYWRIVPVYVDDHSFDQKLQIVRIKNPDMVYLDPDINDVDGLDARFGFVFEDLAHDRFRLEHPEHTDLIGKAPISGTTGPANTWITTTHIRVAEYYRKQSEADTLHLIVDEEGNEAAVLESAIPKDLLRDALANMERRNQRTRKRRVLRMKVEWFKIAGNEIIDNTISPGKFIPIIRCVAEETVIQGIMDRKGHTRALKDPQRMYNYNSSGSVEYGALQSKIPYIAAAEAIAGYESMWERANIENFSVLPFKSLRTDGAAIPPPQRQAPPMSSELFLKGMEVARYEMMMASGQYEAQFGQKSNEISGVAINARQRKGDNATYHYIDAQAVAIRATGRVLIDQIPFVYDTERVIRIKSEDGKERNVRINPDAEKAYEEAEDAEDRATADIIFNPKVGEYAVVADPGPSYATRRQETFNALMQIISSNDAMMSVIGDLFFRSSDFHLADEMAERFKRTIPPNIIGDAPPPEVEALQNQVMQLQALLEQLIEEGAGKDEEAEVSRYDAVTRRLATVKDMMPLDPEGLQEMVRQQVVEALGLIFNAPPPSNNGGGGAPPSGIGGQNG